jgi:hypothetical protein
MKDIMADEVGFGLIPRIFFIGVVGVNILHIYLVENKAKSQKAN